MGWTMKKKQIGFNKVKEFDLDEKSKGLVEFWHSKKKQPPKPEPLNPIIASGTFDFLKEAEKQPIQQELLAIIKKN